MTTKLQRQLIDLLWDDDSKQAAKKAAARCSTERHRDHALWIAPACQNTSAFKAFLAAGTSDNGRIGACAIIVQVDLIGGGYTNVSGILTCLHKLLLAVNDPFLVEVAEAAQNRLSQVDRYAFLNVRDCLTDALCPTRATTTPGTLS